jgi:hypothetical protein
LLHDGSKHRSYGGDEPVPFARIGFNETRLTCVVSEHLAKLSRSDVEALIYLCENVLTPEPMGEFLFAD